MKKPMTLTLPNGETYRAMVLQVVESDGLGPRVFRRLREEESVDVQDGMTFWVVYAKADVLDEKPH